MGSKTVGDFVVERLRAWDVERIYGYPGDGINGLLGALNRAEDGPELLHVRHEEMSAFMACAQAKFERRLGVCMATGGPGAIHLLNGLYDAKMDHQPVLAIVGDAPMTGHGGDFQQEVDLPNLFKDVANHYVHRVVSPGQLPLVLDRAIRIALHERTVTCVIIPADLQDQPAEEIHPRKHGYLHSSIGYAPPRVIPEDRDLRRAAEVLNAGERVAMLIGAGAMDAADEVHEVCELLGCGVAKALLGKAAIPDDLPFVTGSIGLLGTEPSSNMMRECDTLLMVGTSFPYAEFLPRPGQARGVQIDIDGTMVGIRYPTEVNLVGDARSTLRALIQRLQRKEDRSWREGIERDVTRWWRLMEQRAMVDAEPLNPQRVFHELSPRLPERAIVTSDSGSAANWFARHLKIRPGMKASLSGGLATMGPGVPYAVAAKFSYPERVSIALVGDGAMQMNGLNELITIAQYWERWEDPRLVVLVLHNNDLNQVTWEMRAMEGDPRFEASQYIPAFPYARYAELLGLRGLRIERPDQVANAWDEVLNADRPAVLEAITDPEVPPTPPHVTYEQARAMGSALFGRDRDPASAHAMRQIVKDAGGHLPREARARAEGLLERARGRFSNDDDH